MEVRIPIRHVGLAGITRPRRVGSHQRCEGEPALPVENSIPLPATGQLVHEPSGAPRKSLPITERQLIAVARVELVGETEAGDPFVQVANIGTDNSGRLVFTR